MNVDFKSFKLSSVLVFFKKIFEVEGTELIGLDIGHSSIKAIKLLKKGSTYKLTHYSFLPLPELSLIEDEIHKKDEIIEILKNVISGLNIQCENICFGFFGQNTISIRLQLPGGTKDEIEDYVYWEAEQYLPFPIDESVFDYSVVGENEGGGVDVIIVAMKKILLLNFKEVIKEAGVKLKVADLAPIALSNIFEYSLKDELGEGDDNSSWLFLDIGSQKTEYVIYKNGMPIFTKELQIGGDMVTEEIQRRLSINYLEAEDLKVNLSNGESSPEEVSTIAKEVTAMLLEEIDKTMKFYVSSRSDHSLVACYVTGGSVQLPDILEGLSTVLEVDVSVFNPFRAIEYDKKKFTEEDLGEIAYKGAVALGLAMREPGK